MRRVIFSTMDILFSWVWATVSPSANLDETMTSLEVLLIPAAAHHRRYSVDLTVSYRLLLVKFYHQPLKGHFGRSGTTYQCFWLAWCCVHLLVQTLNHVRSDSLPFRPLRFLERAFLIVLNQYHLITILRAASDVRVYNYEPRWSIVVDFRKFHILKEHRQPLFLRARTLCLP